MKIGTNIKKLRMAQGLTQDQLAEKLYVTRQTVSSWERSASNPNLEQLEAVAQALEVDVMVLLYGRPQPAYRPSRRQVVGTILLVLVTLVLWAACWKLGPWCNGWMKNYGVLYPHFIYYYWRVVTALLGGVALVALARLGWKLPLEGWGRRLCLGVGLVLLAAAVSYGPIVGISVNWGNVLPPWLNRAMGIFLLSLWQGMFKAVALVAGIFLALRWPLTFSRNREEGTP